LGQLSVTDRALPAGTLTEPFTELERTVLWALAPAGMAARRAMATATPPPTFHLIGAQPTWNLEFLRCRLCRTCHLAWYWPDQARRGGVE
jgi:hypothetical protein